MITATKTGLEARPKFQPRVLLPNMVNSVAISDDGKRVVGCYYYFNYPGTTIPDTHGEFSAHCSDADGKRIWSDQYTGCQGVFGVAISGDGKVAAAGGLLTDKPQFQGLLRAYDADNGNVLLDYQGLVPPSPAPPLPPGVRDTGRAQRVGWVSLSAKGEVLAAAADKIYVFLRNADGTFPAQPTSIITFPDAFNSGSLAQAVTVHPSGKWLAGCDKGGNICAATIDAGTVQNIYRWSAPKVPIDRNNPASASGSIVFLSVAVSDLGDAFVVGGGDFVFLFTLDSIRSGKDPIQFDSFDPHLSIPPLPVPVPGAPPPPAPTTPPQNVRWVAISSDGNCVTTVVNRYENGQRKGALIKLDGQLKQVWQQPLPRNPNSTSVDGAARYVTACDGYPVGTPGAFYLFDAASGNKIWEYGTSNMNWPMVISKDGQGIVAGGDDGLLYYFDPNQPGSYTGS